MLPRVVPLGADQTEIHHAPYWCALLRLRSRQVVVRCGTCTSETAPVCARTGLGTMDRASDICTAAADPATNPARCTAHRARRVRLGQRQGGTRDLQTR